MPRRSSVRPKEVSPDLLYKNKMIAKLINRSMRDGKKFAAQKQVYKALELLKGEDNDPLKVFSKAMENIKPIMEVRPRRVGGAAYQIPVPVKGKRKESLAIRWLIAATRARPNSDYHTFAEKLAAELKEAAEGAGGAVKKRLEVEKIAESNRAFAHFRW